MIVPPNNIYRIQFFPSIRKLSSEQDLHIDITNNKQCLLILSCKKLYFNFIIFLIRKYTFVCQLEAFNTNSKLAPAHDKEFRNLAFTTIFLDGVRVFYNQHHLTASPIMRKSLQSKSVFSPSTLLW